MVTLAGNNFSKEDAYYAIRNGKILTLTIMLENKCNFKCPFCYTQTKKFNNELNTDEVKDLILQGKQLGARSILIAGAGEPLLAYNFWEIVEFIRSNGLDIVVFSNLSNITKDIAKRLYDNKVSIIGKINSFKKEKQERIIGNISGAYEKMKLGLEALVEAGFTKLNEKGETMLAIETSILPDNVDEIFDLWKYCRENNIFPLVDTVLYEGSAKKSDYDSFLVDYDIIKKEIEKIYDYDKKLGYDWKIKLVERENHKGIIVGEIAGECHRIGTNINFDSEGNMFDCFNMSQKTYGNIRNRSLLAVWEEDKPYQNAICVHGLCKCRDFTDRIELRKEIPCLD